MVAVVKSGGNAFHGTLVGSYESPTLQSDNITPALQAQGLKQTSPLQHYYDMAADLGGRLIRDKLWFYGGLSRQDIDAGLVGFAKAPGPDGVYLTADDVPGDVETRLDNENLKLSYQASRTAKLVGVWQHTNKFAPAFGATRLRPLEAEPYYKQPGNVWKGELQAAPSNGLLIDALGGYGGYFANYQDQPGSDVKGNPSRFDQRSGLYTGPQAEVAQRPQNRYEARGSVSYFPDTFLGGKHQFKGGVTFTREDGGSGFIEKASGNYLLTFNGPQPIQITTYNFPIVPVNRLNTGRGLSHGHVDAESTDDEPRRALRALPLVLSGSEQSGGAVQRRRQLSRSRHPDVESCRAAIGRRLGSARKRQVGLEEHLRLGTPTRWGTCTRNSTIRTAR